MKKHIAMLCAVLLTALAAFAPGAAAVGPALTATEAYCIIDADTGLVLAQQNMNEELHPASITKVMTLGLACEKAQGKWDNVKLTVSHEDVYSLAGTDSSHIALQEGEEVPLTDALYATMMASANDGANLLAEYFGGGSIEGGVAAMNAQAKELGLEHTHFANPHGLPNDDHYTTAHDLYRITKEALSHELFATICNTVKHTVPATNLSDERTLSNTNGLINPESPMYRGYYYEYAKGVKTGHTDAAGYCLISTAEKDGVRLLCVVLGGKGTTRANGTTDFGSFSDTLSAYRWVFANYGWRDIVSASDLICEVPVRYGRDSDSVTVRPAQSISAVLPSADAGGAPQFEQQVTLYSERDGKPLEAPVKAGDEVGELTVSYDGTVYGTVKLVAAVDVAVSKGAYIGGHLRAFFTNPIVLVVLLLVVLAVIGYVLWLARRRKQLEAELSLIHI